MLLIISKDHPILPDFNFSEWVSCNRSRNRLVIPIFSTSIRILRTFCEKRDSNVICKLFFPSTVTEIEQSVSHIWVHKSGSTGDGKAGYRLIKRGLEVGTEGECTDFSLFPLWSHTFSPSFSIFSITSDCEINECLQSNCS